MDALRDLLACPICGRTLAISWQCEGCGVRYTAPDGIPNLRLGGDARTDAVRRFYERAPFPGYGPRDSLSSLCARAERSKFARLLLRLRRFVARMSGYRWVPFDPVLRERDAEPARREAWLRDQYQHPEEHRHTVGEVQNWFNENGVEYVRTYPSALLGETPADLLTVAADTWSPEAWLAQLAWMRSLGHEGGLFVTVGRRQRT